MLTKVTFIITKSSPCHERKQIFWKGHHAKTILGNIVHGIHFFFLLIYVGRKFSSFTATKWYLYLKSVERKLSIYTLTGDSTVASEIIGSNFLTEPNA